MTRVLLAPLSMGNYVQSTKCSFLQLSVKMAASSSKKGQEASSGSKSEEEKIKEVLNVAKRGTADEMKKLLQEYGTDCLR
jgi:hypothetical protein